MATRRKQCQMEGRCGRVVTQMYGGVSNKLQYKIHSIQ